MPGHKTYDSVIEAVASFIADSTTTDEYSQVMAASANLLAVMALAMELIRPDKATIDHLSASVISHAQNWIATHKLECN